MWLVIFSRFLFRKKLYLKYTLIYIWYQRFLLLLVYCSHNVFGQVTNQLNILYCSVFAMKERATISAFVCLDVSL